MKKEKYCHFYMVPFTGLGAFNGYRGDHVLRNRIEVFNQYTLKSLIRDSKKFYSWFCWRKEEKTNKIVIDFIKSLASVRGIYPIHTFGGIPFWDDKYPEEQASKRLMRTLEVSLPVLSEYVGDADYVLSTIQPNDDMYFMDSEDRIMEKAVKTEPVSAIGWKKGLIMNYNTKEIAEYTTNEWTTDETSTYHTDTTPPFFTIKLPREVFLDPKKHYEAIGPYKSHEYIGDVMPYHVLEGRGFVVGTHGENISTTYNHRYRGRVLTEEESEGIMVKTGTLFSEKLHFKPSLRLRMRQIVNRIPFNKTLKNIYYLLPQKHRIL